MSSRSTPRLTASRRARCSAAARACPRRDRPSPDHRRRRSTISSTYALKSGPRAGYPRAVINKTKMGLFGLAATAALTFAPTDAAAQGYGPRRTYWEEGDPVPRGYRAVPRMRTGLVIAGAVTFGVTYLTTALAGAAVNDISLATGGTGRSAKLLLIPVFGPFTMLGSTISATGQFFLVLDGLVQAAGVGMFATGLAWPRMVLVPSGRADISGEKAPPKLEISPVPMTVGSGNGVGILGRF